MKKFKNILLVIIFTLLLPLLSIAQMLEVAPPDKVPAGGSSVFMPEPTSGETGTLANDDTVAVPIDTNLWVLILVGSAFVFYKYKAVNKNRTNS